MDFGTVVFIIIIVVAVIGSKIKKAMNDEANRANNMAEEMRHRRIGQEGGVGGPSPEPLVGAAVPGGKQNSLQDLLKTLAQQAQVQVRVKEVTAQPKSASENAQVEEYSGEGPRNVDLTHEYRKSLGGASATGVSGSGGTAKPEYSGEGPRNVDLTHEYRKSLGGASATGVSGSGDTGRPEYSGEGPKNVDLGEGYRRSIESADAARTRPISEQAGEPPSSQPRRKKSKKQRLQESAATATPVEVAAMAAAERADRAASKAAGASVPVAPAFATSVSAEAFLERLQELTPWQRAVVLQEVMALPRAFRETGEGGWA